MTEQRYDSALFEYIQSILYDDIPQEPDWAKLGERERRLGLGLRCLSENVMELKAYAKALAEGALAVPMADERNPLCESLREIHESLCCIEKGTGELHTVYGPEDLAEFHKREKKLKDMAFRDLLTGLYNRRFFLQEMSRLREANIPFVIVFLDIDGLKAVNDTFGHQAGDNYINLIKEQVECEIRATDIFARIGGDEFALIFPYCTTEAVKRKMERIRRNVSKAAEVESRFRPGFSWGLAYVDENEVETNEELIWRSDMEMYRQKKAKKNTMEA